MPLTAFANEEARRNYIRTATDAQACQIIKIAFLGRELNGDTTPIVDQHGTPECHACTREYPRERLTTDSKWKHICPPCGEIAEHRLAKVRRIGHSVQGFVSEQLATV